MDEIKEKKRIINILYVIAAIEPDPGGGAERALINLAKRVDQKKYKPIVCCVTRGSGPLIEELKEADISVYILGKKSKIDISVLFKLMKIIKKEKISIIHTYMFTSNMWGRLAAILSRMPIIITSEQAPSHHCKEWYQAFIDRFLSFFSDKIITIAPEIAESVIKNEGVNQKKLAVIFNGIELDKFNKEIDVFSKKKELGLDPCLPIVGIVGGFFRPVKRVNLFIEIARLVLKVKPQTQFVIVGGGTLLNDFKGLAERLGIREKIFFLGFQEDVSEIFKIMDIYVLTSESEGLPTVLIEAGASGVPAVSFDIGAVRNIIRDGKTGFLIPPDSTESMVKSIIELLDNPSMREEMGKEAKEYIRKFDVSKMVESTESLYEELINKKMVPHSIPLLVTGEGKGEGEK